MIDPSMNLSLTVFDEPGAVVLAPTGELDYFTSPLFAGRLAGLIDLGRPSTVLDLTSVSFCDSVGIAALIEADRHADRRGTRLRLRCLQPAVRRALSITGLDTTLTVEDSPSPVGGRADSDR